MAVRAANLGAADNSKGIFCFCALFCIGIETGLLPELIS